MSEPAKAASAHGPDCACTRCRGFEPGNKLAEGHGRELTSLSGWEPADLRGVVGALKSVIERPMAYRPVRRLEVLTWDGKPMRETEAVSAFLEAGFTADGPRLSWDGYPGTARRLPG